MALRLALLLLLALLSGCGSVQVSNPKQVDGNSAMQPLCIFWCISTKTVTVQEGANVQGASGTVSISKPLTESVSSTVTETVTDTTTETSK
jgi:hypothetical protein